MTLTLFSSDGTPASKMADAEPVRVLVVDDDSEAVQEMADTLGNFGFDVKVATDYRGAMEAFLRDESIGVVLADIHMPKIDGLGLAKSIRSSGERGEACQMIFVTGHPALDTAVEAIKMHGTGYLTKPVDPIELHSAIRAAVDQHRRRRSERFERAAILGVVKKVLEAKPITPTAEHRSSVANDASQRRVSQVETLLKLRDLRGVYLPKDIFSDPAWFMILDLYLCGLSGKKVSVSSLCLASGGSQTTALRRVHDLVRLGIVLREEDRRDRRRAYLKMSDEVIAHLEELLDRLDDTAGSVARQPSNGI